MALLGNSLQHTNQEIYPAETAGWSRVGIPQSFPYAEIHPIRWRNPGRDIVGSDWLRLESRTSRDRNSQLAKMSRQKASVVSPSQVITALPDVLPLPVALSLTGLQLGEMPA